MKSLWIEVRARLSKIPAFSAAAEILGTAPEREVKVEGAKRDDFEVRRDRTRLRQGLIGFPVCFRVFERRFTFTDGLVTASSQPPP